MADDDVAGEGFMLDARAADAYALGIVLLEGAHACFATCPLACQLLSKHHDVVGLIMFTVCLPSCQCNALHAGQGLGLGCWTDCGAPVRPEHPK